MPPTPTPAMFSFSLGGVLPGPPNTLRGTMEKAAAAAAPPKKVRREVRLAAILVVARLIVHGWVSQEGKGDWRTTFILLQFRSGCIVGSDWTSPSS